MDNNNIFIRRAMRYDFSNDIYDYIIFSKSRIVYRYLERFYHDFRELLPGFQIKQFRFVFL